jgi:pimeloyl-ACP methyl ester carboxylesterase
VCGTLDVPEDRADPSGRRIDLNVAVIAARGPEVASDPVFFLAGGPGGAATETWATAALTFPEVHANRDIVVVDQRGTGHSNPLLWPELPDLTGLSGAALHRAAVAWARTARASLHTDPSLYTSDAAADDLDDVRAALGYDRIDLYGGSYGATLAQYYLRRHGNHARAVVLDGGSLLDVPVFELIAARSEAALMSAFDRCRADPTCHASFPDPAADLAAAMRHLSRHPVRLSVRDPSTGRPTVMDAAVLAEEIHHLLVVSHAGDVPRVVHLAATGVYEPIAELLATSGNDPDPARLVMGWAIRCSEGWAAYDPARVRVLGAGSYLLGPQLADSRAQALGCSVMRFAPPPSGDAAAVHSDVPILLLNGSEDPQDPPANVSDAPRELPNSLEVVVPGYGHTVGQFGCVPRVVAAFLDAGSTASLDTRCVLLMRPLPFATT